MSAKDWKWCGHAHHFVAANSCRFHLSTFVAGGRYLVSSVGDYHPGGQADREAIGAGPDAFFETMVFCCNPDEIHDGCYGVADWAERDGERYASFAEANEGHMAFCLKYDRKRT